MDAVEAAKTLVVDFADRPPPAISEKKGPAWFRGTPNFRLQGPKEPLLLDQGPFFLLLRCATRGSRLACAIGFFATLLLSGFF